MLDYKGLGREYTERLLLKTCPLAVYLVKEGDERNFEDYKQIEGKYRFCYLTTIVRNNEIKIRIGKENINCDYALENFGFGDMPSFKKAGLHDRFRNPEVTAKVIANLHKFGKGEIQHICLAPLSEVSHVPDLVLFNGDSAQMMGLIYGWLWIDGQRMNVDMAAHSSICSEAVVLASGIDTPHLAIPCMGARKYGLYNDDELTFSIKGHLIEDLIKGIVGTKETGYGYPVKKDLRI